MLTEFNYKEYKVVAIEKEEHYIFRFNGKEGYTWFETAKDKLYLKISEAYKIEKERMADRWGKYAFVNPIVL